MMMTAQPAARLQISPDHVRQYQGGGYFLGANLTPNMRRIYPAQFAADLVMKQDGSTLWGVDDPFLKDRQRVNR